ncbi:MAG: conjugal transfer protein TraF [Candidatus Aenigmatarchaeota archaeon]
MLYVLVFLIVSFSFSQPIKNNCTIPSNFYQDRERGYFYGEVCIKEEKKKEEKKEEEKQVEKSKKLSEEELSKEERLYRKYSSIPPERYLDEKFLSSINPLEYRYAYDVVVGQYLMSKDQRWAKAAVSMMNFARKRSLAFSYDVYNIVTQTDSLNPAAFYGRDSWSGPLMQSYKRAYVVDYLKGRSKSIGVYFFTSSYSMCPFCKDQFGIYRDLIREFGFSAHVISYDSCSDYKGVSCEVNPSLFEKFQVEVIPNMVMVYKKSDGGYDFAKVGTGLITLGEVRDNIYRQVRYFETGTWEDWLEVGMPKLEVNRK